MIPSRTLKSSILMTIKIPITTRRISPKNRMNFFVVPFNQRGLLKESRNKEVIISNFTDSLQISLSSNSIFLHHLLKIMQISMHIKEYILEMIPKSSRMRLLEHILSSMTSAEDSKSHLEIGIAWKRKLFIRSRLLNNNNSSRMFQIKLKNRQRSSHRPIKLMHCQHQKKSRLCQETFKMAPR